MDTMELGVKVKAAIYDHYGIGYECKNCEYMTTTEQGMNVKAANL